MDRRQLEDARHRRPRRALQQALRRAHARQEVSPVRRRLLQGRAAVNGLIHHIDLNASDLAASKRVYGLLLGALGYTCVRDDGECEWDIRTPQGFASIGLRQARLLAPAHERYAPGIHHLAWSVDSRAEVDRIHVLLRDAGTRILEAPALYPEYSADYYAVFFEDPDGIKLEVLNAPSFSQR
ncbi:MAG: VOC family protein [Sphingosinicella sp.]|nr:VOC family protein [Sphingosinicella sp.]